MITCQSVVVEAHFVGDYTQCPVKLKSLTVPELRELIGSLLREYEPITSAQLESYFRGSASLPTRSFYLTFDDGIRDHVTNVLPLLKEYSLEASFFIPGCLVADERHLPLLEKQRFLQYAYSDYIEFLMFFCDRVALQFPHHSIDRIQPSPNNLAQSSDYLSEYNFYSTEERYYRFLRDRVLNEVEFNAVIEELFDERFGSEEALVAQYYLSAEDVRVLKDEGMVIGGHTYSHGRLPCMADQWADILRGLEVLERVNGVRPTTFSYPYGSYDTTTLQIMEKLGMAYAFATQNRACKLDSTRPYEITRIDAKDLIGS